MKNQKAANYAVVSSMEDDDAHEGDLSDVGVGDTMGNSGERLDNEAPLQVKRKRGLNFFVAAFFIVAQVAGAGFLALPRAMSDAGWWGIALTVLFCVSVGYSGTRLGRCWVILEQRWPEYSQPSRQPYMDIATRAIGIKGRRFTLFCVLVTLIGSVIVFIILIAEMLSTYVPSLNQCAWSVIVGGALLPVTWLGTPKDFWQAPVLAVISTVVAIVVIVTKIMLDRGGISELPVTHKIPTVPSFSLAFGAILFSFGGASVFPTVQNDMKKRSDFWKSIAMAFVVILILYAPVQLTGYIFIGDAVESNVLLSLKHSTMVTVAVVMEILNLLGTAIITFNPVAQSLEDIAGVPSRFGWKRVGLRSGLVAVEVFFALAIPDFGLILNLIGGSTIACLNFILPPIMYMRLVDDNSNLQWPKWHIPTWERIYLWFIVFTGVIGGLSASVAALVGIISPESFKKSCVAHFTTHAR